MGSAASLQSQALLPGFAVMPGFYWYWHDEWHDEWHDGWWIWSDQNGRWQPCCERCGRPGNTLWRGTFCSVECEEMPVLLLGEPGLIGPDEWDATFDELMSKDEDTAMPELPVPKAKSLWLCSLFRKQSLRYIHSGNAVMALHLAAQVWPPPWLPQWSGLQGNNFLSIFRGLLQLSPSLRWLPQLAQCSVFGKLLPTVLPGQMLSMANGARGATSVIQGSVEDTLLSWLQQDPAWFGLLSEIGTDGKDNDERNVKLEIGGYVSLAPPVTKYCNTMDCIKPFFAQYVYGFGRALQNVNHDWLMQLTEEVRFRLSAIPAAELGERGRHFFNTSFCDTAFAYACAQVMLPGQRCDPALFDGGASTLMGILTLCGNRSVHLEVDGAWLPSVVQQKPSSFYIGSLASVYHFVEHLEDHGPCTTRSLTAKVLAEG